MSANTNTNTNTNTNLTVLKPKHLRVKPEHERRSLLDHCRAQPSWPLLLELYGRSRPSARGLSGDPEMQALYSQARKKFTAFLRAIGVEKFRDLSAALNADLDSIAAEVRRNPQTIEQLTAAIAEMQSSAAEQDEPGSLYPGIKQAFRAAEHEQTVRKTLQDARAAYARAVQLHAEYERAADRWARQHDKMQTAIAKLQADYLALQERAASEMSEQERAETTDVCMSETDSILQSLTSLASTNGKAR